MNKLLSILIFLVGAKLSMAQRAVDSLAEKNNYPSGITFSAGILSLNTLGYHISTSVFTSNKRVQVGYTFGYNNVAVNDTLTANAGWKPLNSVAFGLTARAFAENAKVYVTSSAKYLLPVYDKRFNARGGLGLDFGFGVYSGDNFRFPAFIELGVSHMAFITPTLERPSATVVKVSVGTIF